MKKLISLLALVVLLAAVCAPAMADGMKQIENGDTLYVKTTGGTLNVREQASAKSKVTYKLPNNSPVIVVNSKITNNFIFVEFKYQGRFANGYVSMDYMTVNKPGKVNNDGATKVGDPTPRPTSKPDPKPETGDLVKNLSFSSYKLVDPGWEKIIAAKPNRTGGWVNLRWAPSMDAAVIEKMYKGMEMKVIAEGKSWYQVQAIDGYVGFISKEYTYVVSYLPIDVGYGVAEQ